MTRSAAQLDRKQNISVEFSLTKSSLMQCECAIYDHLSDILVNNNEANLGVYHIRNLGLQVNEFLFCLRVVEAQ